jgi:DNA polymerase-3 subunit gamma/tau
MSSLHTKYRPQRFDGVIGQGAVCKSFAAALKKGISHQFLLHGPSGTGKTTLARIAGRELGCTDQEIDAGEINAAIYTGIDDMRSIAVGLSYRPLSGKIKPIIIDECHMLSKQAWNSLLKPIEEPPPWVYWFLCTTEIGKVPATIKTRCTTYELKLVDTRDIEDMLEKIAAKEQLTISRDIISICAKRAEGSPRQALVNLGACASAATPAQARELLQAVEGSQTVIELCQALLAGKSFTQLQPILADLADQNGEGVRQVVRAYMTKVIVGAKSEKIAGNAAEILNEFSTPFYSQDGLSPVVMACCRLSLS